MSFVNALRRPANTAFSAALAGMAAADARSLTDSGESAKDTLETIGKAAIAVTVIGLVVACCCCCCYKNKIGIWSESGNTGTEARTEIPISRASPARHGGNPARPRYWGVGGAARAPHRQASLSSSSSGMTVDS